MHQLYGDRSSKIKLISPVKVAIPIVPTIRVLITFTKVEELQPIEEFSTPLSSPAHFQDA
ncbi:Ankyrin repeat domain-containing protein 13 - like 1 [Theobroma cacao]|nr:Ankyrin repeat domain-containing protein 13 - like 1 [Theobroma cacao]